MSCLPCPSLHSFLAFPDFFRFYHSVHYCYIYFEILVHAVLPRFFLAALYFLTFPLYPLLSVPTLLSCPITSVCVSCLHFSEQPPPPPCHYSIVLLGIFLLSIPLLSLAVCPVSCPVRHPWSIPSKDLHPNTQSSIRSWLSLSSFSELKMNSLAVLAFCPRVLSCYPVLGVLS